MNKNSAYTINEIEYMFKEHFCLTENEIKDIINKIIAQGDETLLVKLRDVFNTFVKNDIPNFSREERRKSAKIVVKNCLDLYIKDRDEIVKGFFSLLENATVFDIDPFKIATKHNMRNGSGVRFEQTLSALVDAEYTDLNTGKTYKLLDLKEFKDLIENCSTIACKINENNVREILDILSIFMYDLDTNTYFLSPKETIKRCNSLLAMTPERLQSNIDFLTRTFVPKRLSEKELTVRVAASPSILMCSPEKIETFHSVLKETVKSLYIKNKDKLTADSIDEVAESFANNFVYDINKLNTINSLTNKDLSNISAIKNVLEKHLGAQNVLHCITDMNILKLDPILLDGLLIKLNEMEKNEGVPYRKYFVENAAKSLNLLKNETSAPPSITESISRPTGKKRDKIKVDSKGFATDIDTANFERLTKAQKKLVDDYLNNIKAQMTEDNEFTLPEEQQEELDFITEVKNGLVYNEYDYKYIEYIDLLEKTIDRKMGQGYANKTYKTEEIKKLYTDYRAVCNKAKELLPRFSKLTADHCRETLSFPEPELDNAHIINRKVEKLTKITEEIDEYITKILALRNELKVIKSRMKRMSGSSKLEFDSEDFKRSHCGYLDYSGSIEKVFRDAYLGLKNECKFMYPIENENIILPPMQEAIDEELVQTDFLYAHILCELNQELFKGESGYRKLFDYGQELIDFFTYKQKKGPNILMTGISTHENGQRYIKPIEDETAEIQKSLAVTKPLFAIQQKYSKMDPIITFWRSFDELLTCDDKKLYVTDDFGYNFVIENENIDSKLWQELGIKKASPNDVKDHKNYTMDFVKHF